MQGCRLWHLEAPPRTSDFREQNQPQQLLFWNTTTTSTTSCRGMGTSGKPRWPQGLFPKPSSRTNHGKRVGKRGSRRYKRVRRISSSPRGVPRWDCSRRFKWDDKQELVRRRSIVDVCRGYLLLQRDSISDAKLCGVAGRRSVFVALVG